jgi:type I restriction-modification system DNA methylase subunit
MSEHYTNFAKILEKLGRKYDRAQIFNDFLTMAICANHRTNIMSDCEEQDSENDMLYMGTIKKYSKEELEVFPKALVELQLNLTERPYSDILGDYFTMNITNGQNGQFFTPEPVCELMARFHGEPGTIRGQTVHDPACGSGRILLSFAKTNPQNLFFGADNNNTCVKMTVLNMFLNRMQGEVAQMNSLSLEWYASWHINTESCGIVPIEKEQSLIWTKPVELQNSPKTDQSQLRLF